MQNNRLDLKNLSGYEFLEKKNEPKVLSSYNEEYFGSLNSMNDSLIPIDKNKRLAIGSEINSNSSVTSMTGQILNSYEDLIKSNIELFKQIYYLTQEIKEVKVEIEKVEKEILLLYKPEIDKFRKLIQTFLCEQKTENFRLLKEIKQLETDKYEIQEEISYNLEKLTRIEKSIGVKCNVFSNQFDKTVKGKEKN